ncbi:unnamed protein product, partial [Rotaria sp. Silwood2]
NKITIPSIVAGIEMGVTGCKVAISDENGQYDSQYSLQISTTTPKKYFSSNKKSKTYGFITTTPKPSWQNINVVDTFQGLNVPTTCVTDVNAHVMTEAVIQGDSLIAYITIETVKRIVIGGGLSKRKCLFIHIRNYVKTILDGFLNLSEITKNTDEYIIPSNLGDLIDIQSALDITQSVVQKKKFFLSV